jgi:hypothetical protein
MCFFLGSFMSNANADLVSLIKEDISQLETKRERLETERQRLRTNNSFLNMVQNSLNIGLSEENITKSIISIKAHIGLLGTLMRFAEKDEEGIELSVQSVMQLLEENREQYKNSLGKSGVLITLQNIEMSLSKYGPHSNTKRALQN